MPSSERALSCTAFVGLGSNLARPILQVKRALIELQSLQLSRLLRRSSLYRSAPMGPGDQRDYINAVAAIDTALSAFALLDALQSIENAHGRTRGKQHWGPRTLDLDLLLFGDATIDDARLKIPHPGISERAFVLHPLYEIAPDLTVPGLGPLAELLRKCPPQRLQRLTEGGF
ncbi:MAG: 2-amino-4-hydroxy-6-hydroxymethyldihydropteridine diphosphokinase [Gammaproteobacteria bacterium]